MARINDRLDTISKSDDNTRRAGALADTAPLPSRCHCLQDRPNQRYPRIASPDRYADDLHGRWIGTSRGGTLADSILPCLDEVLPSMTHL